MSNIDMDTSINNVRPRQVLLVGLGGVGSRTVDKILSVMPEKYKQYTKAIAVDTDLEDLSKQLKEIPVSNRIALGSNPDNGQSITVGEYIRNNPNTTKWFVKGGHLDTIKRRNTAQGAKQIRMVSRIALAATNEFCGMKKTLEDILQSMNHADGTTLSQGLLVMIVCSIAGGTGAGTVLQFPLYLEQALTKSFPDDTVQMECAMLLPNIFSRVQDPENQSAARANAYAVIKEMMSLNSGRLKRGDVLPDCNFEEKAEKCSPYGRVLFFDDVSMSGDSLELDLDKVFVPKIAGALNEYLFGPVSGKITSALDNTLAKVYRTAGASIFSSVGTAKLEYPRMAYMQYVTGQWINKVISETWLDPDKEVDVKYKNALREAIQNDKKRPEDSDRRKFYRDTIDSKTAPFYKEIRSKYYIKDSLSGNSISLADDFWNNCKKHLAAKLRSNDVVNSTNSNVIKSIQDKSEAAAMISSLTAYGDAIDAMIPYGLQYEIEVMRPIEAKRDSFYAKDKDENRLYSYIKEKQLHPIMIRYFLYELYEKASIAAKVGGVATVDTSKMSVKASRKNLVGLVNEEQNNAISRGQGKIVATFAKNMLKDLEEYIHEVEDMFKSFYEVVDYFSQCSEMCINSLEKNNSKTGAVLAGGPLSMVYSWKCVNDKMSSGEDVYTIDPDLNLRIHEIAYRGFIDQVEADNEEDIDGGTPIRVRTKYESIIVRELQRYYAKILRDSYQNCFPKNVIDAALIECGLANRYKDNLSRTDEPEKYTVEYFLSRAVKPLNFATDEVTPDGLTSDAACINALMSAGVSNSKPYCGRVDDGGDPEGNGIINRLLVANEAILRTKIDPAHTDVDGVAKSVIIDDEFVEGASTSRVGSLNVNSKFLSGGISRDEVVFVTTIAGLQPFNFVAFLPEDDNEHAPTKGKTYYMAYRTHIDHVAVRSDYITPHLHRDWHLADKLEDITPAHTQTYNKEAAIAFVNGFIFNVIEISSSGIVNIGKLNDPYFTKVFSNNGIQEFLLLEESILADMNSLSGSAKKDKFNALFVKIYELLATSEPIRDAINAYAEQELAEYSVAKNANFIRMCLNDKCLSGSGEGYYRCIIEVMDGYYQGTRSLPVEYQDGAKTNVGYMFDYILREIYKMCTMFSSDFATLKNLYETMITKLYQDAKCDDKEASAVEEIAMVTDGNMSEDDLLMSEIDSFISGTLREQDSKDKLFTPGQMYSEANAKGMIDSFLNN